MGVTCCCYCCGRRGCVVCPCLVEAQGQAVRLRLFHRQGLLPVRAASFQQRRRQACRLYHAQPPICDAHQPERRRLPFCVAHSNAPAQRQRLCFYRPSHTCRPRRSRQPSRQASVGMHKRLHRNFSRSPCLYVTISVIPPPPHPPTWDPAIIGECRRMTLPQLQRRPAARAHMELRHYSLQRPRHHRS